MYVFLKVSFVSTNFDFFYFRCEGSARIFGVGISAFDPSLPGKIILILIKIGG